MLFCFFKYYNTASTSSSSTHWSLCKNSFENLLSIANMLTETAGSSPKHFERGSEAHWPGNFAMLAEKKNLLYVAPLEKTMRKINSSLWWIMGVNCTFWENDLFYRFFCCSLFFLLIICFLFLFFVPRTKHFSPKFLRCNDYLFECLVQSRSPPPKKRNLWWKKIIFLLRPF